MFDVPQMKPNVSGSTEPKPFRAPAPQEFYPKLEEFDAKLWLASMALARLRLLVGKSSPTLFVLETCVCPCVLFLVLGGPNIIQIHPVCFEPGKPMVIWRIPILRITHG